ncbi:uncharacterized protein LOC110682707 isoform X1 [Chenopodium quinoa]|uniref:uncharacterized protein LOC110682707 isoform X1 n=1 Tax=Chenopodium quinoa TaxID=63459 RepID=UPI000B796A32|nr:uncharacterized protein LOC110682707 isoform X1 [Chenopodium quinoa]
MLKLVASRSAITRLLLVMEPKRGLYTQKSSKMTNDTKGIVIGVVAAVIACSLAFLNERRSKTRRLRIIRQPYINRDSVRSEIVNSVLYCGDTHCLGQIRIRPQAFFNLCNILVERGLLKENIRIGAKGQVMIFLYILGHNVRFRAAGGRFFRSIGTIHHYFHVVLKAILKLYPDFVKPQASPLPSENQNNPRFFPWFEDFIGVIDGTHIRAYVPIKMQGRFRGRKGGTTPKKC